MSTVPEPTTIVDLVSLKLNDASCPSDIQLRGIDLTSYTVLNPDYCNSTADDQGVCCEQCTNNAACEAWFWVPDGIRPATGGRATCLRSCILRANVTGSGTASSDDTLTFYSGFNCSKFNCSSVELLANATRLRDTATARPTPAPRVGAAPGPGMASGIPRVPARAPAAGPDTLLVAPAPVPAGGLVLGGGGVSPSAAPATTTSAATQSSSSSNVGVIAGAAGGGIVLALVVAALLLFFCCYKRGRGFWAGRGKAGRNGDSAKFMHPANGKAGAIAGYAPVGQSSQMRPKDLEKGIGANRYNGGFPVPVPVPGQLYTIPSSTSNEIGHGSAIATEDFDYRTPDVTGAPLINGAMAGRRTTSLSSAQDSAVSLTHPRGYVPDIMSSTSTAGLTPSDHRQSPQPLSYGSGRSGSASLGSIEWEVRADQLEFCKLPDGRDHVLGMGAFGQVYKAYMNGVTPVAVKIMLHDETPKEAERFPREVAILRACHDRNVVSLLGICAETRIMLITEFCENGDLWKAIGSDKSGEFLWNNRGRKVAQDIARGLVYLHGKGIVHFDLKSPNILLDDNYTAKIADVGLSKMMQRTVTVASAMGTFAWAAPEQILGQPCSEKADIWSFGIILWEIVTGEHPKGRSMRPLRSDECPDVIARLFLDCTNPDPEKRPSAREVYNTINLSYSGSI